jgi:hypothetical protein
VRGLRLAVAQCCHDDGKQQHNNTAQSTGSSDLVRQITCHNRELLTNYRLKHPLTLRSVMGQKDAAVGKGDVQLEDRHIAIIPERCACARADC